jgi:hypothetical protein
MHRSWDSHPHLHDRAGTFFCLLWPTEKSSDISAWPSAAFSQEFCIMTGASNSLWKEGIWHFDCVNFETNAE